MSSGMHPFGDTVKRQLNILSYECDLKLFSNSDMLDSTGVLAEELIKDMISREPVKRPTAKAILSHPFFWNAEKILNFLQVCGLLSGYLEKKNLKKYKKYSENVKIFFSTQILNYCVNLKELIKQFLPGCE